MEPLYQELPALLGSRWGYQNEQGKGLNGLIIIVNAAISLKLADTMAFQEKPFINGKGDTSNTIYLL
jgi:hypothetical protein